MPPETNIYLILPSSQVSRTPRQYCPAYFPQSALFSFIPRSLNPLLLQKPIPDCACHTSPTHRRDRAPPSPSAHQRISVPKGTIQPITSKPTSYTSFCFLFHSTPPHFTHYRRRKGPAPDTTAVSHLRTKNVTS